MKYIVIGGVAAGTKAAAKIMRQDRSAEVCIYTKGKDISYAGCGLPYYVGGSIETRDELIVNTPAKFTGLTGVQVRTEMEAIGIDANAKVVSFANGEIVGYDKLVIATGAVPFVPNVAGTNLPGVFTVRTPDDAINMRSYIEESHCRSAVVVGGGFIGVEMAENLAGALGISPEQVNVKATTEEGLGFTGDGSGMAAHAVVLLEKNG